MTTLKVRAFIPDLDLYLYGIAVYFDSGMIGIGSEDFEKAIEWKFRLLDDEVYPMDDEGEKVMSVLTGDEWLWIEAREFELEIGIMYENRPFEWIKCKLQP